VHDLLEGLKWQGWSHAAKAMRTAFDIKSFIEGELYVSRT
jgi:hypothetical protein